MVRLKSRLDTTEERISTVEDHSEQQEGQPARRGRDGSKMGRNGEQAKRFKHTHTQQGFHMERMKRREVSQHPKRWWLKFFQN